MVALLKNQLRETGNILRSFKGNARGCLIAEPLWAIPYNLYIGYASVYMVSLGCTDVQVGIITSVGLLLQALFSLISGYITDRMGRKKTSLIFDIIGWTIPTVIWAVAQNFYFFLVAAIINSVYKIVNTSWTCLLVEDTEPEERVHVYTWLAMAGILAGFFAPLAGVIMHRFSLIPTMRGLYIFTCLSMTTMFFLRNHITHETRIGLQKMEETKGHGVGEAMTEYLRVIVKLFKSPYTIAAFVLLVLNSIQVALKTTFFSIMLTEGIKIPVETIGIFPAINSVVVLLIFLFVMPWIGKLNPQKPLVLGYFIAAAGNLLLVLCPEGSVLPVVLSVIVTAAGTAVVSPIVESVVANSIPDKDRANATSILYVILMATSAPFGYIGGLLSSINPRLPIVAIAVVFTVGLCMACLLERFEKSTVPTGMEG